MREEFTTECGRRRHSIMSEHAAGRNSAETKYPAASYGVFDSGGQISPHGAQGIFLQP